MATKKRLYVMLAPPVCLLILQWWEDLRMGRDFRLLDLPTAMICVCVVSAALIVCQSIDALVVTLKDRAARIESLLGPLNRDEHMRLLIGDLDGLRTQGDPKR